MKSGPNKQIKHKMLLMISRLKFIYCLFDNERASKNTRKAAIIYHINACMRFTNRTAGTVCDEGYITLSVRGSGVKRQNMAQ